MSILNAQGQATPQVVTQAQVVPASNALGIPMDLMVKANNATDNALGNFVERKSLENAVEVFASPKASLNKRTKKDKVTGESVAVFTNFDGDHDLDEFKKAMSAMAKETAKGMTEAECLALWDEIGRRNTANGYRLGIAPSADASGCIKPLWVKVGKPTKQASAAQKAMEAMGCTYDPQVGKYRNAQGQVIETD